MSTLPTSVRYVKNGPGGRWWPAAKAFGQIHASWKDLPAEAIRAGDLPAIQQAIRDWFGGRTGAMQDFNAIRTLIDRPSQHVWVTFEGGLPMVGDGA